MNPRWPRRAALGALGALALLAIGSIAARRGAVRALEERQRVLDRLVADARAATDEAESRLRSGAWDLAAEAPSALVADLLQEFVGYRQRTRRGNVFVVRSLDTTFHDGYAELRARADFDWRWGLYDGPVEATYYAFARVRGDGGCDLYFRVARLKTLAPWPLFNRFLEPILTNRLQRLVEVPNIALPLGLALPAKGEGEWRRRFPSGLEVTVPGRPIDLGPRRALPLLDAQRIGVVVERPGEAPQPASTAPGDDAPDRVWVAARLDFISERLAAAVSPAKDVNLSLDRFDRVWIKRTRKGTDMSVDLVGLRGTVDVRDLRIEADPAGLIVEASLRAVFAGQAEGAVLRIRQAVPLRIESIIRRRIPLVMLPGNGGLALRADLGELELPLDIETRLGGLPLRFATAMTIPGETLARALRLPGLAVTEFEFPTDVERGAIVASKRVPLAIAWAVTTPSQQSGAVEARGDVRLR